MPNQPSQDFGESPAEDLARQLDEVTGALEALSQALDSEEELRVVLQRCCQQVIHAIPGADLASITLLREEGPSTPAATDELAIGLDEAQYDSQAGPCLESAKTGEVVRITLDLAQQRWPNFARAAGDAGIGSVLSAPLFINSEYQGSLNLYGTAQHGYRELDAKLLELYTTAVEAALRADRRYRAARDHAGRLREALTSRAVIDQAKGIIMAARRVDADTAFAALVEQSQRENAKLRELADRFVNRMISDDS